MHGLPMRSAALAKRRRRLRILAALTAVCLFGFVAAVAREIWPLRAEVIADVSSVFAEPTPAAVIPVAAPASERPVYRHSIVPGGAYTRAEVADAMRTDAVVAAHYENIDVAKVHAKRIDVPRAVYVSYRVGNQVYWSKNRVKLSPGETVLTDGDTEIRARCGNLLSDDAQQPVAGEEPPLAALDEAEPETGSSTMAGERGPEGALAHVPFLPGTSGSPLESLQTVPGLPGGVTPPMWFNSGGDGASPSPRSSTGTNGTSLVAPLGGSERKNSNGGGSNGGGSNGGGSNGGGSNGGGSNGGGSNDGGSNGGGSNGGGSNGGGSNGGGSNGGGSNGGSGNEEPPKFIPPPTTGDPETTTTGDAVTTTTGNTVNDTTGGDDTHTVPEPGTLVLLGLGACGLASRALRARRKQRP